MNSQNRSDTNLNVFREWRGRQYPSNASNVPAPPQTTRGSPNNPIAVAPSIEIKDNTAIAAVAPRVQPLHKLTNPSDAEQLERLDRRRSGGAAGFAVLRNWRIYAGDLLERDP